MKLGKLGIVVPCYNRPDELRVCLTSISDSELPRGTELILINDGSTDKRVADILAEFAAKQPRCSIITHQTNEGVCKTIRQGFQHLFLKGFPNVCVLDSDAIVRRDWLEVLQRLHGRWPQRIITGFNSLNTNLNGNPRHPIVGDSASWGCYFKSSVGGINMLFTKDVFDQYVLPALNKVISSQGNWDAIVCAAMYNDSKPVVVSVPSVVQHMATTSVMGHTEEPDVASDFYALHLPKVSLLGVDCVSVNRLVKAAEACTKFIKFADVRLFTHEGVGKNVYRCPPLKTIQEYSRFMVKELVHYFDTEYVLVIQHDGYVVNYRAWSDDFMDYDYVGATWWYKDGHNVGNGGFSLRSKKLCKLLQDEQVMLTHPEDARICRTYRPMLESKGIKFAPAEVADRFSIEAAYSPDKNYSGSFGFHGRGIIFNNHV